MIRLTLMALFLISCLMLAGCERDEPELKIDTPEGGVEVHVDD